MILVAVVILVGVFFVATGRGGELAYEQADHAPLDLGPVSATDVALLRPPTALWGYNMQVTDEALERIAQAIRDRDVTITFLQQRLADLTTQTAAAPVLSPAAPADVADRPIDTKACRARSDRWRWSQAAGPDAVADKGAKERRLSHPGWDPAIVGQRQADRPPMPPGHGDEQAVSRLPEIYPPVPRLPRNRVMGSPVRRLGARADNLPASQPACGGCPAALTDRGQRAP